MTITISSISIALTDPWTLIALLAFLGAGGAAGHRLVAKTIAKKGKVDR